MFAEVLHEVVVNVEDRDPCLGEVGQGELVADDRHIRRRYDDPLSDNPDETPLRVVDLDAGVSAIAHVDLQRTSPPVDDDTMRAIEAARALFAREGLQAAAVPVKAMHEACSVAVGDPNLASLLHRRYRS